MKKLKLNVINDALTKAQMKEIKGGESRTCTIQCCDDFWGWYVGSQGTPSCDQSDANEICDALYGGIVCGCQCTY